jgi:tellurite resistance protein
LMARADGTVSSQEMAELRRLAQAMDIDEPLDSLMADVDDKSVEV